MAIKITNPSMADDVREYVKELSEADKVGIKYFFAGLALGEHSEASTQAKQESKDVDDTECYPKSKKEKKATE